MMQGYHKETLERAFYDARFAVLSELYDEVGIGTLSEKSLHRILKLTLEPRRECHEVKYLGSIADIQNEDGVTEIQTRNFEKLVPKLKKFLPETHVTVVYPLPAAKLLRFVDPETAEVKRTRKSPKKCTPKDAFFELSKLRSFLHHENLCILLIFLDVEEYRYLDGYANQGTRGSTRIERIPCAIANTVLLKNREDYVKHFLPPPFDTVSFTVKEYAKAMKLKKRWAYTGIQLLIARGILAHVETRGREYVYQIV